MIRQTSLMAYNQLLLTLRNDTYNTIIEILRRNPDGMTDRELSSVMGASDPNRIRPRRNELVKMGKLKQKGKKICQVSGKTAIIWVTLDI